MSVIPLKAYRLVERRLRDRWELAARAKAELYDAQMAAYAVSAPPMDQEKHGSGPGNRTQAMVLRILDAERKVEEAAKWEEAIRLTDKAFPWESTSEGVIAGYLYGNGMNLLEVCRATGKSRGTVTHFRDNYVAHCALFAAALGLIDIQGEREHGKNQELADP